MKGREINYGLRENLEKAEGRVLHHICHKHPLTPTETPGGGVKCFGCGESFLEDEAYAYGCIIECEDGIFLHEDCAELQRKIELSEEDHLLHQKVIREDADKVSSKCKVCKGCIYAGIYYGCIHCSDFAVHLRCGQSAVRESSSWWYVYEDDDDGDGDQMPKMIQHPSHQQHELRLLRKPSSFSCAACGEYENDRYFLSYICIICQYWIHERCALLPPTIKREIHHHHPLSLAFRLPQQYAKFQYRCDICTKDFPLREWVYHCEICSYVVHIKCSIKKSRPDLYIRYIDRGNADNKDDALQLPINDVSEELIRPFVMKAGGKIAIPRDNDNSNSKFKFYKHHHQLSLISSDENDDNDDDLSSELICDGCTTLITHKMKQHYSSSSSSSQKYYYYSCGECKYFLHLASFNLPSKLPNIPFHLDDHSLVLQSCSDLKLKETSCDMCGLCTNGLFYACTECNTWGGQFIIDIKCASLTKTIIHAAHPQHTLKLTFPYDDWGYHCGGCGFYRWSFKNYYKCDHCQFSLDLGCALLPAANKHRRDKHPLLLTYDANVNHPQEFYCEICEEEMNPKRWMYHCRECDQSYHPDCIPAACGEYRNIKFGQQCVIATCHDPRHPLTYQLITRKRCCDLCREYRYGEAGFQCTSCNFVMCFDPCGKKHENAIQAFR